MIVYQTRHDGTLAGTVEADPNPLEPGEWLIPGGCVTVAPPAAPAKAGHAWAWRGNAWTEVVDWRGIPFWLDGEELRVTLAGVDLPPGATLTKPEPPIDLKAALESAVQAHIDAPAQAWGYDDARAAVTYVGDPFPRFHAEGVAIRAFRSACWVAAHQLDADVAAGHRAPPTIDELLALLPAAPARPT